MNGAQILTSLDNRKMGAWLATGLAAWITGGSTTAQCPSEPLLTNHTPPAITLCQCFNAGDEVGVVLNAPPAHYPIEILKVEIGWASGFSPTPPSLESAIHIYPAGK